MKRFTPQRKNANKHTLHGTRLLEKSVQSDGWIDLFPAITADNIADCVPAHVEYFSKFSVPQFALTVYLSNLINLFFCEFCSWVILSCRLSMFIVSVNHIFGISTEPKMRRIDALSIVACMADKLTAWYTSVMQDIRNAMSKHELSVYSYNSISRSITGSRPLPASVRLIDVAPKCINLFFGEHNYSFSSGWIITQ